MQPRAFFGGERDPGSGVPLIDVDLHGGARGGVDRLQQVLLHQGFGFRPKNQDVWIFGSKRNQDASIHTPAAARLTRHDFLFAGPAGPVTRHDSFFRPAGWPVGRALAGQPAAGQAPARAKILQNQANIWQIQAKSGEWILDNRAKIRQKSGRNRANGFWSSIFHDCRAPPRGPKFSKVFMKLVQHCFPVGQPGIRQNLAKSNKIRQNRADEFGLRIRSVGAGACRWPPVLHNFQHFPFTRAQPPQRSPARPACPAQPSPARLRSDAIFFHGQAGI